MPQYPKPFLQSAQSSSIASLCHALNMWSVIFSQDWIRTTLWELASQDIYDETYAFTLQKF
jgi:hypothetical protein